MSCLSRLFKIVVGCIAVLAGTLVLAVIAVAIWGEDPTDTQKENSSPTSTSRSNEALASLKTPTSTTAAPTEETIARLGRDTLTSKKVGDYTCADFDSWIWAQSVFDSDRDTMGALDPEGNGVACDHLTVYGFAPAFWSDGIPDNVTKATLVKVSDGDTIRVRLEDGSEESVRLLHIDTPETSGTIGQCGGTESTDYLNWILSYADGSTVYLENDVTERDRYDRRLAYVWFSVAGDPNPYMANHAMVLAGWAQSETYEPDVKYKSELDAAEAFSVEHVTGVRLQCGKFAQPANNASPSEEQVRQAWLNQPNQGQLPPFPGSESLVNTDQPSVNPSTAQQPVSNDNAAVAPEANNSVVPVVVEQPAVQQPVVEQPAVQEQVAPPPVVQEPVAPEPQAECDPSYPDFCLAPAWVIGDLDCPDVGYTWFTVYPPDSHGFDRDGDGYGCESN